MAKLAIGDEVRLNLDQSAAIIIGFPSADQTHVVSAVISCSSPSKCGCKVAVDENGELEPSHVLIAVRGLPDFFDAEWFSKV